MAWLLTKYFITAAIIILISELAKLNDRFGALIAALPTVSILVLIWMNIEGLPKEKLSNHAFYTFWYVIPSLPMFLAFPYLYKQFSFWTTITICLFISISCFLATAIIGKYFGIKLI